VDLKREIVAAAVNEVVGEGLWDVAQENALKILDFVKDFEAGIPTAVVALDYALYLLCMWAVEEGVVKVEPSNVN